MKSAASSAHCVLVIPLCAILRLCLDSMRLSILLWCLKRMSAALVSFGVTVLNAPSARVVCFANVLCCWMELFSSLTLLLAIKSVMLLPTWMLASSCLAFIGNDELLVFLTLVGLAQLMSEALVLVEHIVRF